MLTYATQIKLSEGEKRNKYFFIDAKKKHSILKQ